MDLFDYIRRLRGQSDMFGISPSMGGLNATNYPNPHGLRAFKLPSGEYGGQMMPKTSGWQGEIPAIGGGVITELSLGGNTPTEPFFPMVTQNMSPEMIGNVRKLEAGLLSDDSKEAQQLRENAYKEYLKRKAMGLSAFKDYN